MLEAVLTLPDALRDELGPARVWIWSPQGVPQREQLALLLGLATLMGVSTGRLGLEIPAAAISALDAADRACLADAQRAGLQAAIRIVPGGRRSQAEALNSPGAAELERQSLSVHVARAHALRMLVHAAGVEQRSDALALAAQGITAVSGPAVSPPLGVDHMRRFLGPAEAGLQAIRADSL